MSVMSVFVCEAGAGGVFCEMLEGVVPPGHWNRALASTAAHTYTANIMEVRPSGFEVFCIRKCRSTSNACFVYVRSGRILFAL